MSRRSAFILGGSLLLELSGCARPAERAISRGNAAARDGHLDEARALYASAPESAHARALLGLVELKSGHPPQAALAFTQALALDPREPTAATGLARLDLSAHDAGAALTHLPAELATLEARCLRAEALLGRGGPQDAAAALTEALAARALEPEGAWPRYLEGSALLAAGRAGEAVTAFEQLRQREPGRALGAWGLARAHALQGHPTEALQALKAEKARGAADWNPRAVIEDPAFGFLRGSADFEELLSSPP